MERATRGSNTALWLLATALARQGREPEAHQTWARADSINPGAVNPDLVAAGLWIRRGDFDPADEILRRLSRTASPPTRSEARWLLMISLRVQGRVAEALSLARGHPSQSALGIALFEAGHTRQAAALFERHLAPAVAPPYRAQCAQSGLAADAPRHVSCRSGGYGAAGRPCRLGAVAGRPERIRARPATAFVHPGAPVEGARRPGPGRRGVPGVGVVVERRVHPRQL